MTTIVTCCKARCSFLASSRHKDAFLLSCLSLSTCHQCNIRFHYRRSVVLVPVCSTLNNSKYRQWGWVEECAYQVYVCPTKRRPDCLLVHQNKMRGLLRSRQANVVNSDCPEGLLDEGNTIHYWTTRNILQQYHDAPTVCGDPFSLFAQNPVLGNLVLVLY